jgi:hypothetical protein
MFSSMYWIIFLWWYLDHVIAENRGVAYSFYFMFQKKYWMSLIPNNFRKPVEEEAAEVRVGKKKRNLTAKDLGVGVTNS